MKFICAYCRRSAGWELHRFNVLKSGSLRKDPFGSVACPAVPFPRHRDTFFRRLVHTYIPQQQDSVRSRTLSWKAYGLAWVAPARAWLPFPLCDLSIPRRYEKVNMAKYTNIRIFFCAFLPTAGRTQTLLH